MKTKTVLLIGLSLLVLSVQTGCGSNNEKKEETVAAVLPGNTVMQTKKSAEQITEERFYDFVQELTTGNESSQTLVCADFPNRNQAFSFIITLISPMEACKSFDKKTVYESDLLKMEYCEDSVTEGFARLSLKFKKRQGAPSYTVIFVSGD